MKIYGKSHTYGLEFKPGFILYVISNNYISYRMQKTKHKKMLDRYFVKNFESFHRELISHYGGLKEFVWFDDPSEYAYFTMLSLTGFDI